MRNLIFTIVVATTFFVSASGAHAQIGGGLSPGGLTGPRGLGLGTLNSGPDFGARPNETMSMPQMPSQQWVPPRQQYDPAIGRNIYVPPHYADRAPDGRLTQPPMTVPSLNGGPPVFLPGGENPAPGIAP
jgi:hypothetical protein